jgi:hypothetical protein
MRYRIFSLFLVLLCLCAVGARAESKDLSLPEQFNYRWTLAGFKGAMARLFIPGQGEGHLTTDRAAADDSLDPSDHLITELLISSRVGQRDEYWLYGAEIDASERRTVRAWSAQRFRGKSRKKEREAKGFDALDLASSIYYLRQELPDRPREETIWSSGRLNPVIVRPGPRGNAEWKGRRVATRSYSIRGLRKPGRPVWQGKMDLVLTDDEEAVPLEIRVVRKGVKVRLELVESVE